MRRDVDLIDMIYLTAGYIAKESGRDDLQAEYTKGEGWRLTGLYKDGSRSSVGGLGVVPDDREFYHRLTAFWNGVVSMKRWMTGDAVYSYTVEKK